MSKTFFIDIDGVFVTDWSLSQEVRYINETTWYEPYSKESISALNMIIKAVNPKLVIHSSRRFQFTEKDFKAIWTDVGIEYNNLSVLEKFSEKDDKWFDHPNEEKEYDLSKFIALNQIAPNEYLILEDEQLAFENVYFVDGTAGLSIKDAEAIIKIERMQWKN